MYEIVIYCLLAIAIMREMFLQKGTERKLEYPLFILIALVFLIRFSIGPDSGVYAQLFNRVSDPFRESMTSHMGRNFLYTLLSFLSKKLFGEYRWLVLVQNALILGGCSFIIFRFSNNKLFSLLLFIGSGMLEVFYGSGVRQGLAMTVYLISFYLFLPRKQFLLYEIGCLLAFGFQEIALVVMPLPLLFLLVSVFKKHPYRVIAAAFVASMAALFLVKTYVWEIAWTIILKYGSVPTWTHVVDYLREQQFSILGIGMESVFFIGFITLYLLADKDKLDNFANFSSLVFLFSVLFYFSFACYDLMSRVSDFIQVIILVLIPNLVEAIPDKNKKLVCFAGVFLLNGFLLFSDINANLRRISVQFERRYTLMNYPYVCVFDKPAVDAYQVYLDRE